MWVGIEKCAGTVSIIIIIISRSSSSVELTKKNNKHCCDCQPGMASFAQCIRGKASAAAGVEVERVMGVK